MTSSDVAQNVDHLIEASRTPARSRSQPIAPLISDICDYAYQHGLRKENLSEILDLLRSTNYLDQGSVTTLVKGLYPAERVTSASVCSIVASLGQGEQKPSPATQGLLLQWMILIYDVLEDAATLRRLYVVLFNLLDMLSIRSQLCHLLALLTRRNHVKPYRIQMLLELNRGVGHDPGLAGLLRVYKEFYPEIVLGGGRQAKFEHPNPEWRGRLQAIQEVASSTDGQFAPSSFQVMRNGIKRRRVDIVPEVHTRHVPHRSVALEEIRGLDDFVEKFERIEPPGQLIAALDDPLLRTWARLRQDEKIERRLDSWLAIFLDSQMQAEMEGEESSKDMEDILNKLLKYTIHSQELPQAFRAFIPRYLEVWNGRSNRRVLLELLSYLPLQSFEDLKEELLDKLERAMLDNSESSCTSLLTFYTDLLRNWTSHLLATDDTSPSFTSPLDHLVSHSSDLILRILTTHPTVTAQAAVLHHLSTLANTISHAPTHPVIRILTPSPKTVYLLTFLSPTVFTLSSLTAALAIYKVNFEDCIGKQHAAGSGLEYPRPYVNEFNGFLMDICNLIWRLRAFNTTDTNALGCLLPASVFPSLRRYTDALSPPHALQGLFSLSCHPALAALSIAAFREMEDRAIDEQQQQQQEGNGQEEEAITERHAGPVTQRSLALLGQSGGARVGWSDYRLEVLQWLAARGVDGVKELMFRTMKLLMAAKSPGETGSAQASPIVR